jgi:hypothetical protein
MTERILGTSGSTRRWRSVATTLAAAMVLAVVFVAGSDATSGRTTTTATCPTSGTLDAGGVSGGRSNFEIDAAVVLGTAKKPVNTAGANLTLDGSSPCLDWTTAAKGAGNNSSLTTGVMAKADKDSGTGDDSFTGGTSENSTTPTIASGSIPPNKSDLQKFGVYRETNSSGKFLDLFWSRVNAPSGTVDMDFELNKLACDGTAVTCSNNGGGNYVTPLRSSGDRLITYDLANGGTVPTISIYTWGGSASSGSWTNQTVISGGSSPEALGSINYDAIDSADGGTLGAKSALTFGEVSVSYKALFGTGGNSGCGAFGSVYLKSRSSNTFTDEMKDFVAPESVQITNCATLTTNASNQSAAQTLSSTNTISDSATLSGATAPTGTVVFKAYGPFDANSAASGDTCNDTSGSGNLVFTSTAQSLSGPDTSGNYSAGPASFVPSSAGRYEWIASYGSDANNIAGPTSCKDANEFSLVQETPTVGTTLSSLVAVNVNTAVHDSASITVTSSYKPTGSVTYAVYSNSDCSTAATVGAGNMIDAQPGLQNVNANGSVPNSTDVTFQQSGTYYWQASYSGDSNYAAAKSVCTSESLVVSELDSTISTVQSFVPNDTATITGTGSFDGKVSFVLYPSANCSGTKVYEQDDVALGAGNVASTTNTNAEVISSPGGSFSWKVTYSGDSTHKDVQTSCALNRVETSSLTIDDGMSTTSP